MGVLDEVARRLIIIGDVAAISWRAELEREVIRRRAADHELSVMDCSVVERTRGRDVLEIMTPTTALVLDVV